MVEKCNPKENLNFLYIDLNKGDTQLLEGIGYVIIIGNTDDIASDTEFLSKTDRLCKIYVLTETEQKRVLQSEELTGDIEKGIAQILRLF